MADHEQAVATGIVALAVMVLAGWFGGHIGGRYHRGPDALIADPQGGHRPPTDAHVARGMRAADPSGRNAPEQASLRRSEEELDVEVVRVEAGRLRARKVVEHDRVEEVVPGGVEHAGICGYRGRPGTRGG